jgi:hypothetical protein
VILEAVSLGTKVICPPGIPEFDEHLATFTLAEISRQALTQKLEAIWQIRTPPSYSLNNHRVNRVVEQLATIYNQAK